MLVSAAYIYGSKTTQTVCFAGKMLPWTLQLYKFSSGLSSLLCLQNFPWSSHLSSFLQSLQRQLMPNPNIKKSQLLCQETETHFLLPWKLDSPVRITRRRQWHPTPVLLPGKSHGWRSLVGCSPWGRKESDMTERLHFHFSLLCIGEGNGNPLQCSCLENPRDGGHTESDTTEVT